MLFTISTVFLPLDELQAEVFLKVAAETIPPPCCRPSPAARLSRQYTTAHQPSQLRCYSSSWRPPLRQPGCTLLLPAPCDGQPSAPASGPPDPCLALEGRLQSPCPATRQLHFSASVSVQPTLRGVIL